METAEKEHSSVAYRSVERVSNRVTLPGRPTSVSHRVRAGPDEHEEGQPVEMRWGGGAPYSPNSMQVMPSDQMSTLPSYCPSSMAKITSGAILPDATRRAQGGSTSEISISETTQYNRFKGIQSIFKGI